MNSRRRHLLTSRPVQLGIVTRLVCHWLAFLAAVVIALPLLRTMVTGDLNTPILERLSQAGIDAAILGLVFVALLPYFVYDILRSSNRFTGPIFRLQKSIRATGHGASFQPVKFREKDHWQDLADDFNDMMDRLENGPENAHHGDETEQEEPAAV